MNISITELKVWNRSRKGEATQFEPAQKWEEAAEIAAVIDVNGEPVIVFVDAYQYSARFMGRWYPSQKEKTFVISYLMKEALQVKSPIQAKTSNDVLRGLDLFMKPHVCIVDQRSGVERHLIPGCGAFEYHGQWAYVQGSNSDLAKFNELAIA